LHGRFNELHLCFYLDLYLTLEALSFLRLRAWDAQREQIKKTPRHAFIDEMWGSVKPA